MTENFLKVSEEIRDSISSNKPVVALESTIISHGMPYPENLKTAKLVEKIIRDNGAIPATIGIIEGKIVVGLNIGEISYLASKKTEVIKSSTRDIPFIFSKNNNGSTTVAGTVFLAQSVGIKIMATGGIGGVHRNAVNTLDISSDLQEISKNKVTVVCSGPKSILDLSLTKEYLETVSVPIIGYNTKTIPTFFTKDSQFDVDFNFRSIDEIANAIIIKNKLKSNGGMIVCNPISNKYSIPIEVIENVILKSIKLCELKNITGKEVTPFLLEEISNITKGESLKANIDLIKRNAELAAKIASKIY